MEKIEDACRFTSRLLEHGDAVEILALRRIVGMQLMNLIKNTPKPNVCFSIEFQTDYDQFEKAVRVNIVFQTIHINKSNSMRNTNEIKCMITGSIR